MPRARPPNVGIDGCRGGWFAVWIEAGRLAGCLYPRIADFAADHPGNVAAIDVPIGLTANEPRYVEKQARRLLGSKRSSVFSVPCRRAVYARTYESACRHNQRAFGKKISVQAWNICAKIREVDRFCLAAGADQFFEAHPELVFHLLYPGRITGGKKTAAGQTERLACLQEPFRDAGDFFAACLNRYPRKDLQPDDILDAVVLCALGQAGVEQIPGPGQADERGLPVRMLVPAGTIQSGHSAPG